MLTVVAPLLGIALPALLLTLAVRRWVERVPWAVVAMLLVAAIAGLGPAGVTSDLPVPLDAASKGWPFAGVTHADEVGNPLTSETARLFLAWRQVAREALLAGRAPLYNPYALAGTALLGNAQTAPLSPFFLATLPVPLPEQLEAMAGLELFVALLFGFLLARREGVGIAAAVAGALVYGLALYHAVFLHFSLAGVSVLAPAVLLFAGRVASGSAFADLVGLALATAATILGGHPESTIHVALAALGYVLLEAIAPAAERQVRWRTSLPSIVLAVAVGTALAAPAWLTFAQQAVRSERFAAVNRPQHDATRVLPAAGAAVLVDPEHFGHPARDDWEFDSNFAEVSPAYVGLLPLVLLAVPLISPAARRRDRWLLALIVLTWLVAFRWTPLGDLVNRLPVLAWTANARLRFVAALGVAILTARTLGRFGRRDLWAAAVASAGALGVAGMLAAAARPAPVTLHLALAVATVAAFWLALGVARGRLTAAAVATPLIAVDLLAIGAPFNAPVARELYAPPLPIVDALRRDAGAANGFRVVGLRWALLPQTATWYELEDVRGADPMGNSAYLEVLNLAVRRNNPHGARLVTRLPQPVLDMLGVRYLFAAPHERPQASLVRVYSGPDGVLYRNPRALDRFFAPRFVTAEGGRPQQQSLGAIRDFSRLSLVRGTEGGSQPHANGAVHTLAASAIAPDHWRVEIEAAAPTVIASSLPAIPGWRLRVNRQAAPVVLVNHAFVGFRVPAGHTIAELRYHPWTFDLGLWLAAAGMLTMLAWWAASRRRAMLGPWTSAPPSS